jgi:hypothetical protein
MEDKTPYEKFLAWKQSNPSVASYKSPHSPLPTPKKEKSVEKYQRKSKNDVKKTPRYSRKKSSYSDSSVILIIFNSL